MASDRTSMGGVGILVNMLKLRAHWENWIHIFILDWAGLNLCLPYEKGKCSPHFKTKLKVGHGIFYAASEGKMCSENAKCCREVRHNVHLQQGESPPICVMLYGH